MERIFLLLWWLFVDLSRSTSISFLLCFDRCFDSEVWRNILFSIPLILQVPMSMAFWVTNDVWFQENDGLDELKNGLTPSENFVWHFVHKKAVLLHEVSRKIYGENLGVVGPGLTEVSFKLCLTKTRSRVKRKKQPPPGFEPGISCLLDRRFNR